MLKKVSILLVVTLILFSSACDTFKLVEHFRVYDHDSLIFHFTKDSADQLLAYNDTLICKIMVRWGVIREDYKSNKNVFYFETPNHPDTFRRDIFTDDIPWNQFTYCFEKGSLYVSDYNGKESASKLFMPMVKVFPGKVKIGQTYTYRNGDYKRVFTIVDKEDIFLGKMQVKDALKVSLSFLSRYGLKTTDTIWLSKMWGIAKWKRIDGYTGHLLL